MKADKNIFFPTGLIFSKRNLEDLTLSSNRCFCFECYIFSIVVVGRSMEDFFEAREKRRTSFKRRSVIKKSQSF